ncbi:VUT family protein [Streptomyces sp. NPDC059679]|uniref:VUT family protein n=1 Tax=Streptomyces sp. NPDC059679 TaxID=3346903 RepID=UPI0036D20431
MNNRTRTLTGAIAVTGYASAITAANWLTTRYGMVNVGFGLITTAGTFAAGAALLLRDTVQDTLGKAWVLTGITLGAILTWATSPTLAIASATAFLAAECADMAIYTPLRARGWARAVLASNVIGAIVDTLLFLALAHFPVTTRTVGGQLAGKLAWATLLPVAAVITVRQARHALSRDTLRA